jgi:hypothetical protein
MSHTPLSRILTITPILELPIINPTAIDPSISRTKTVRKQPEGLRMRYRPFGTLPGQSDSDTEDALQEKLVPLPRRPLMNLSTDVVMTDAEPLFKVDGARINPPGAENKNKKDREKKEKKSKMPPGTVGVTTSPSKSGVEESSTLALAAIVAQKQEQHSETNLPKKKHEGETNEERRARKAERKRLKASTDS